MRAWVIPADSVISECRRCPDRKRLLLHTPLSHDWSKTLALWEMYSSDLVHRGPRSPTKNANIFIALALSTGQGPCGEHLQIKGFPKSLYRTSWKSYFITSRTKREEYITPNHKVMLKTWLFHNLVWTRHPLVQVSYLGSFFWWLGLYVWIFAKPPNSRSCDSENPKIFNNMAYPAIF